MHIDMSKYEKKKYDRTLSIRLTEEDAILFEKIAEKIGCNKSKTLRIMIQEMASLCGVKTGLKK